MMKLARRNFLKYTSILGLMSLPLVSLFAQRPQVQYETIGSTHMDEAFDPDGWL